MEKMNMTDDKVLTAINNLACTMNHRFDQVDERLEDHDRKFDGLEQRITHQEILMEQIDERFQLAGETMEFMSDKIDWVAHRMESIDTRLAAVEINTQVTATVVAEHGRDIARLKTAR